MNESDINNCIESLVTVRLLIRLRFLFFDRINNRSQDISIGSSIGVVYGLLFKSHCEFYHS